MVYVIDTGAIGRAQSSTTQSSPNSSCGDYASVAWSAAMTAARNGTPTGGSTGAPSQTPVPSGGVNANADTITVTVKPGDTLWGIAAEHGIPLAELYADNREFDPGRQDGILHFD